MTCRVLAGLLVLGSLTACPPSNGSPTDGGLSFVTIHEKTLVAGVAWDPEAFFLVASGCGLNCAVSWRMDAPNAIYLRSVVLGAQVTLVTDAGLAASTASDAVGNWSVGAIPSDAGMPYFVSTQGGMLVDAGNNPLPSAPAPRSYLPAVSAKPTPTSTSACYFQLATAVADTGIVQAVANYLTSKGTATSVGDLQNPAKWGGVGIFWSYQPNRFPGGRYPANGTSLQASVGQVLNIDWATPGAGPVTQSSRGFFVVDGASSSPQGIAVVLLPKSVAAGTSITYSFADSVTQLDAGHPWVYPSFTAPARPGIFTVGVLETQSTPDPNNPAPSNVFIRPQWFCGG